MPQAGSIESTWPARVRSLKEHGSRIPDTASVGMLIGESDPLNTMLGPSENYRLSAFTCDVMNRANGFLAHLSIARMQEVIRWRMETPCSEAIDRHYGYHLSECMHCLRECARVLGWTALHGEIQTYLNELHMALAVLCVDAHAGSIRLEDEKRGPRVVHCDVIPPADRSFPVVQPGRANAFIGRRSCFFNPNEYGTYPWMSYDSGFLACRMETVANGLAQQGDGVGMAIGARGWSQKIAPPDVQATIRAAMQGDKDALIRCWQTGARHLLWPGFNLHYRRTTGGLFLRWIHRDPGMNSNMKGNDAAAIVYTPEDGNAIAIYSTNSGSAWFYGVDTTENGKAIHCTYRDDTKIVKELDLGPIPSGETLLEWKIENGQITFDSSEGTIPAPPPKETPMTTGNALEFFASDRLIHTRGNVIAHPGTAGSALRWLGAMRPGEKWTDRTLGRCVFTSRADRKPGLFAGEQVGLERLKAGGQSRVIYIDEASGYACLVYEENPANQSYSRRWDVPTYPWFPLSFSDGDSILPTVVTHELDLETKAELSGSPKTGKMLIEWRGPFDLRTTEGCEAAQAAMREDLDNPDAIRLWPEWKWNFGPEFGDPGNKGPLRLALRIDYWGGGGANPQSKADFTDKEVYAFLSVGHVGIPAGWTVAERTTGERDAGKQFHAVKTTYATSIVQDGIPEPLIPAVAVAGLPDPTPAPEPAPEPAPAPSPDQDVADLMFRIGQNLSATSILFEELKALIGAS